jgi:hypothetical protein
MKKQGRALKPGLLFQESHQQGWTLPLPTTFGLLYFMVSFLSLLG